MINDTKGNNIQHLAIGKWTLNKDSLLSDFTCVYGAPQSIGIREISTAIWDSANNKLVGTWKNILPLTDFGNIVLTKVD